MRAPRIRLIARVRPPSSPASRFVAVSAGIHVALAVAIVFFPSLRPRSQPIRDYIMVTPVGLPAAPPAAAVDTAPAEPEPEPLEPEPEEVRVETRVPEPQPLPEPKKEPPEKKPEKKPEKRPEPAKTPPERPAAPASASPAPGDAGGPGAAGASVESVDFADLEFAWYRDRVVAALKSHWRQPILEGVREPLSVTIAFEVHRDGAVRNPRIAATSGVASLDRSALRAVVEADPLPPLPPNWREPLMSARFVFTWYP